MTMTKYCTFAGYFLLSILLDTTNFAFANDQMASIKEALTHSLCYTVYWGGGAKPKLGTNLPIEIRRDGEKFYAWISDLEVTAGDRLEGFFVGRVKNGEGTVTHREAYNINIKPLLPGYINNRRHFETGFVIKGILTIPSDCTPHYDPPTPQKELMLRTVISTVEKQLNSWVRQGIVKLPLELTIIVADFNIDFPLTYVLVDQTKKLYSVTLHDPQNYDSDEYERSGEYPLGEVYGKSESLIAKVRKYGIIRNIVLAP